MTNSRVVIAMLFVAGPLGAQGIVRGAVMSEQGWRIAGVEVQVPSLKKIVYTDSAGEYRLVLPAGNFRITTRAIGYFSLSDNIAPENSVELIHDFTLTSLATMLEAVDTKAPRKKFMSPALNDFEERRTLRMGRFVTQEEFERYSNRILADVLRRVPGLRIRPGRGTANFATSTRAGCLVSVFLDGLPLYSGLRGEPPLDLNQFQTRTFAGAEFYASSTTVPTQFRDRTGCGMLLLWTRER